MEKISYGKSSLVFLPAVQAMLVGLLVIAYKIESEPRPSLSIPILLKFWWIHSLIEAKVWVQSFKQNISLDAIIFELSGKHDWQWLSHSVTDSVLSSKGN